MARTKTGPTRYAIYARCSSDDQAHRDFSTIEVQIDRNREYIIVKGGVLAGSYKDEGKTGASLKRPGWAQLLQDAQDGKFDMVVVTYMSRLGRGDTFTVAEYLLKEAGVKIETVKEQFTDDMSGHVNKKMTQFVDGMYVEQVRQWTRTKMEAMVAQGFVCGHNLFFGYSKATAEGYPPALPNGKRPPQRFVPHPEEASLVRRAFEIFAETRNYTPVIEYLRFVTPRKWTYDNVTRLLRNELYRGVLNYGTWRNETAHAPIVSEELWGRVREADLKRPRMPKRNRVDDYPYYLRGRVYCPHCGCRMTPASHPGNNGIHVPYYECISALKKITLECPVRRVNAATLHHVLLAEIRAVADDPTRLTGLLVKAAEALPKPDRLKEDLNAVARQVQEIDRRIKRIMEAMEEGAPPRPLLERLKQLEDERLTVASRQEELIRQIAAHDVERPDAQAVYRLWQRWGELWEIADENQRAALLESVVGRVEMQTKTSGVCDLALLPQTPLGFPLVSLEPTSHLGAGVGLEPTTSGL